MISEILQLIGIISMPIATYLVMKLSVRHIKNEVKEELLAWIQTEQASKLLYQVGGIVAQGAKSGFGLNVRGGKFKLEDMLGQLVGSYIQQKFIPKMGSEQASVSESEGLNIG